jgi:tetratricopeptide (TPR) repeat protein
MNAAPPDAPRRTHSRRQRVPPALLRGDERFEGMAVLDEVRDEVGLLLFRSLRNVLIWAQLPASERADAFSPEAADARRAEMAGAELPPELLAPLSVIAELLASPAVTDRARLALACRRVALWAEDRGALGTALDFTQAAALARPEAAMLAYAVGRLARRRAEYDRAESWFARAIIQARQSGDWRAYATAFSGLGNLNLQRGNVPAASRAHQRCLRAALRHGLPDLQANAYHDLFAVAIHSGEPLADRYAAAAIRAGGPGYQNLPGLAFDLAYHWVLQGRFAQALTVVLALRTRVSAPAEQLMVNGLIARAAGGARDAASFHDGAGGVWRIVGSEGTDDRVSGALVGVAHGAASLGLWADAERAAERVYAIAAERSEGEMVMIAESLLASIRLRTRTEADATETAPAGESLAQDLAAALTGAGLAAVG